MIQEQSSDDVLVKHAQLIVDNARSVLDLSAVSRHLTSAEVLKTMSGGANTLADLTDEERLLFERLFDAKSGFVLKLHPALPRDSTFLWVNAHQADDAQDLVVKLAKAMLRIGLGLEAATLMATVTLRARQEQVAAKHINACSNCLKTFNHHRLPSSTGMLLAGHYACLCGVSFEPQGGPEKMTWVPPLQPALPRDRSGDHALLADCKSIETMHERVGHLVSAFKRCCTEGNQEEAQLMLDRLHGLSITDPYKVAAVAYLMCGKYLAQIAHRDELAPRAERLKEMGIRLHCSLDMEIVFERVSLEPLSDAEVQAILDYVASVLANPHTGPLLNAYLEWLGEGLPLSPEQRASLRRMMIDYGLANPNGGLLSVLRCAKSFGSVAPTQDERESLASLMVTVATSENFAVLAECMPMFKRLLPAEQGKNLEAYLTARLIRDGKFDPAQRISMVCNFLESGPEATPDTKDEIRVYCELFGKVLSAERKDIRHLYLDFLSRSAARSSNELRALLASGGQLFGLAAFGRDLEALITMDGTHSERKQRAGAAMRNESALRIANSPQRYLAKEFFLWWAAAKCKESIAWAEAAMLVAMLKEFAVPSGLDVPLQLLLESLIESPFGKRANSDLSPGNQVKSWIAFCDSSRRAREQLYLSLGHFTKDEQGAWPGQYIRELQAHFQVNLAVGAYGAATWDALGLAAALVEYCSTFPEPDLNVRGNRSREEWLEVLRTFEEAVVAPLREAAPRGSAGLLGDAELEALGTSIGALSRWTR
ncbi:hypothetical protein VARIO8X_60568 [Burkholderiales bacterium 8X]|nr:hypothetical protein VARIO8X_60568 [Burkholderiales bacterium 8X]